jgi:lipopolysaccharide/colanic/teichoic acid biosynthesis glycosyltransferase
MARFDAIDFIDTYAAAYHRALFLENKGFDTSFTAPSVEDQEFSFRLARKGYRMLFVPQAIVTHQHDRTLGEYVRRKFFIGYWKAYMLSWHPDRIGSDTHTPSTQRFQVGLVPFLILLAALSPFLPWALWTALFGIGLFSLSSAPLLISIAKRDQTILWSAPGMVFIRALCLASGLVAGFLSPVKPRVAQRPPLNLIQRVFKRTLDVLVAVVGLTLSFPLILLAAVAIKLDSPGPIFFVQERVGEGGKTFRMIKLRTMVKDAEQQLESVIEKSALQGPAFKIPNDPRVTRVGRYLRRWSLDELPQLWNILRGDMSIVGPRPEEVRVVAQYNDWHRRRLAVRPGLTGPMQIRGRGMLDLDERVRLELDYIENYSIWRDLAILLRTVPNVLSGKGAT